MLVFEYIILQVLTCCISAAWSLLRTWGFAYV